METKVTYTCCEEVTEKDMNKREQIKNIIADRRFSGAKLDIAIDKIMALFEDHPAEPERWKPNNGEDYWYINASGEVDVEDLHTVWYRFVWEKRFEFGNCFKTRHEAKQACEKVKEALISFHQAKISV
jgi:hypothetical protein